MEMMPQTSRKYLNAGKLEKETIKDYINATRHMLRKNLTNEARKRDLSQVSATYETEKEKLRLEVDAFDEEHQGHITKKADMENMTQVGSEQLAAKQKSIIELERQVFLL